MSAEKRVILKGSGIRKEEDAGAVITPGMLLAFDGSGDVIPHGTQAGTASRMFAVEEDFQGTGIDDTYASGDRVQYDACHQGMEVNALIRAGAAAVSKGDYVVSAGDGTVESLSDVLATSPAVADAAVVGMAMEAVDNSGGSANARLAIEIV
jgi:hypothetical protein